MYTGKNSVLPAILPTLNESQVVNLNFMIFCTVCSTNHKAVNGGHSCAVWTVLVTATVLYRLCWVQYVTRTTGSLVTTSKQLQIQYVKKKNHTHTHTHTHTYSCLDCENNRHTRWRSDVQRWHWNHGKKRSGERLHQEDKNYENSENDIADACRVVW